MGGVCHLGGGSLGREAFMPHLPVHFEKQLCPAAFARFRVKYWRGRIIFDRWSCRA